MGLQIGELFDSPVRGVGVEARPFVFSGTCVIGLNALLRGTGLQQWAFGMAMGLSGVISRLGCRGEDRGCVDTSDRVPASATEKLA